VRALLSGAVVLLVGTALLLASKATPQGAYLALGLAVPALVGYGYL